MTSIEDNRAFNDVLSKNFWELTFLLSNAGLSAQKNENLKLGGVAAVDINNIRKTAHRRATGVAPFRLR